MKNVLLIFFCVQIFSANTFAGELTKVPFLIQHYFDHSAETHAGETFMDYLVEHYAGHHHDEDSDGNHCDENLPFKHCGDCCSHGLEISNMLCLPVEKLFISFPSSNQPEILPVQDLLSKGCRGIWQPPQMI